MQMMECSKWMINENLKIAAAHQFAVLNNLQSIEWNENCGFYERSDAPE